MPEWNAWLAADALPTTTGSTGSAGDEPLLRDSRHDDCRNCTSGMSSGPSSLRSSTGGPLVSLGDEDDEDEDDDEAPSVSISLDSSSL